MKADSSIANPASDALPSWRPTTLPVRVDDVVDSLGRPALLVPALRLGWVSLAASLAALAGLVEALA